jgi:hypothetical protein
MLEVHTKVQRLNVSTYQSSKNLTLATEFKSNLSDVYQQLIKVKRSHYTPWRRSG